MYRALKETVFFKKPGGKIKERF